MNTGDVNPSGVNARPAPPDPKSATPERILFATDAWRPQINGVVKTLEALLRELNARGVATEIIEPGEFRTVPTPSYPEIRLAFAWAHHIAARHDAFRPDHVHVETEGPIGWAMRKLCLRRGLPFTTSYHTRLPEYLRARAPVPVGATYALLRRLHNSGAGVMVPTGSMARELEGRGFRNIMRCGRGADLALFNPAAPAGVDLSRLPRPIFLSVARLAPEKNLDAFLSLDLPGSKVMVGDGPDGDRLRARHPGAVFLGALAHEQLAGIYAQADVFVFPSLTDTFGLVLVEALACGLPVAAFPAPGPLDVIGQSGAGVLGEDLRAAALAALEIDRGLCRRHALGFGWDKVADQFLANIATARAVREVSSAGAGAPSTERPVIG